MILVPGKMPLPKDSKLIDQWTKHKNITYSGLGGQYRDAREAHAFHAGDEMHYSATVEDKGQRSAVVFNKVKPFVDAVCGFMVQLRRKPDYQARLIENPSQQELSIYMNGISDYARKNANMDQLESRQDREMLVTGYGAVDTNITYESNPDGEVQSEVIRYNDVGWDPQAQEPNILDARWTWRRKAFGLQEALKRFKGSKEEDFQRYTGDESSNFVYNPVGGEYDKISGGGQAEEDLVEVYYYQWWSLDKYFRAKNPLFEIEDPATVSILANMMIAMKGNRANVSTPEEVEDIFEFDPLDEYLVMTPTIKRDLDVLFERFGIDLEYQEFQRKVYYTSVLSGTTVFKKFKSPDQQGFTIKFKTANYNPRDRSWYGMVKGMQDPARYANKAFTEILYVIASNSKGGVMYEESAVEDPARFEGQYATTRAAIKVADGALSGGKIQPKATGALPSGFENIYQIADRSLSETSGINREFLGASANSQVSALLEAQRINQVLATLATYFDAIALYQIEHARLMVTFMRMLAENSTGRLVKIIGPQGADRYEELTEDRMTDEYDIDIGEAPTSATQKQETFNFLSSFSRDIGQIDPAAARRILPIVINYAPNVKEKDKQQLKEALQPDQQQAQAQAQAAQQQQQVESELQASVIEAQKARAAKDIADAQNKKDSHRSSTNGGGECFT